MMKNSTPARFLALTAISLVLPSLAHAHTGHPLAYDCASGFAHPLHGWDHIVAMVAVGVLAHQRGGHARWLLPAAFVGVMSCAAVLGGRGFVPPGVESAIATSVLVFGVLIAAAARLPLVTMSAVVGLFAFAHGIAHGSEMPATSAALSYGAGFMLSTALLHVQGLLLASLASRRCMQLPRLAGAACAATGVVLLLA